MHLRERVRDESGFTIVESMVATLIIIIGMIGGLSIFDSSRNESETAERQQIALQYAEAELERMHGLDYDELVLQSATWPNLSVLASQPAGANPINRTVSNCPVTGTSPQNPATTPCFKVGPGTNPASGLRYQREELIVPTDVEGGTPTVLNYSQDSVPAGGGTMRLHVFRFISWRDEECPVVNLGDLGNVGTGLSDSIDSLSSSLDSLIGTSGTGGSVQTALTSITRVNTLGLPILSPLLGLLNSIVNSANNLRPDIQAIRGQLQPLATALDSAGATLDGFVNPVTGRLSNTLDLCDLDLATLQNISQLRTVRTLASDLAGPLASLNTSLTSVANNLNNLSSNPLTLVTQLLGSLVSTITGVNSAAESLIGSIQSGHLATAAIGDLTNASTATTVLGGLEDDIDALTNNLDTTHNTKRLTVAVVIEPTVGSGPNRPVWASTVIGQPDAGLGS